MLLFKRILLAGVLGGVLFLPGSTQAGDVDDLKAAFEHWLGAYNSRNVEDLLACYHDQAVSFGQFRAGPVVEKAAIRENLQTFYSQVEHVNFSPKDPQLRIIDNTGVVWTTYALYWRGRSAIRMMNTFGRLTLTFVKTEGKWLIVSQHASSAVLDTDRLKMERAREESRKVPPGTVAEEEK